MIEGHFRLWNVACLPVYNVYVTVNAPWNCKSQLLWWAARKLFNNENASGDRRVRHYKLFLQLKFQIPPYTQDNQYTRRPNCCVSLLAPTCAHDTVCEPHLLTAVHWICCGTKKKSSLTRCTLDIIVTKCLFLWKGSGSGLVIQDNSVQGTWKEQVNLLWSWIRQL